MRGFGIKTFLTIKKDDKLVSGGVGVKKRKLPKGVREFSNIKIRRVNYTYLSLI